MERRLVAAAAAFGAAALLTGGAALAQTPSPGPSATAQPGGTGTPVVTATEAVPLPTIPVPAGLYQPGGGPFAFAHPAFERVWDRTDGPVKQGQVSRTWFWGPSPNTPGLTEPYREGAGGTHLVQYFDKSRMEVNNPQANPNDAFFVTNGLLTVDMIAGSIQVGDATFTTYRPACIPMSGDFGDTLAPTYFAFQRVSVSGNRVDEHRATSRLGQRVTETIDRNGNTGTDASKASVAGTDITYFDDQTKHNIPRVFWDFLNSTGQVHDAQGKLINEQLIRPWFFASGLPISEAFWAKATIQGATRDVLIQAYERRALTYVPSNQQGFQVEMANIGQHYFDWRYRNFGICPGTPAGTPTPPVPVGTGTPVAATPTATGSVVSTATPCRGCPTPTITPTQVIPPGTVVVAASATSTRTPAATATATATPRR
jgi:hypothetical protein